jgi:ATP-dependent RNA helicase RhlE
MNFNELEIIEPILKALKEKNYSEPTPIQEKAIPLVIEGKDVLGVAQTGTGKTAAFSIPIIQHIYERIKNEKGHTKLRALIVTPTRELAIQIDDNIKEYSKHTKIYHTVIYGGVKQGKQVSELRRGVDILVATPGRLLDLIQQGFISLKDIEMFVLDEADRMLDMGFINDIRKLLKVLPRDRQSLFFSATMPPNIVALSQDILMNPRRVEVTPASSTAETIQQAIYFTDKDTKKDLLVHILKDETIKQVLVFTKTKHGADKVVKHLKNKFIKSAAIHGDKAQNQRQKALTAFKSGEIRVLVATDIASRGIDINKLQHMINYDIPNEPETYVHRIGRTGRAGEEGMAISISEPEDNTFVRDIEKLIKQKIDIIEDNPYPQTEKPMTEKEKKEWNKEKQRRKQEFFANRKKPGGSQNRPKKSGSPLKGGNKTAGGNRKSNKGRRN